MSEDGRSGGDDRIRRTDGGRDPENLTDLDGIGPARADKLRDAGFETVADVRSASQDELADVLGSDLAGRVKGQLGDEPAGGDAGEEPADDGPTVPSDSGEGGPADDGPTVPTDTSGDEPADSGPSVPSDSEGDGSPDSGPTVPSSSADEGTADDGPSVPSGTSDQSATETDGQDGDDIGWEPEGTSDQPATGGGEVEATVESGTEPTTGTTGNEPTTGAAGNEPTTGAAGTDQGSERTANRQTGTDEESLLAAIVSFILPGIGNMVNGDTDRGVIIFVVWVIWLVVAWGVGFFLVGTLFSIITLGLGFIVQLGIGLLLGVVEFAIHVVAAIDAYRGSKVVDNVTGKVDQVRGN